MLLTPERSEEVKARIQAAVEEALLERDVSARRASLDVVGNDGLIRDIRAGRLPGVDRLEALFEYLGLEFYFGPLRKPSGAGQFAEAAASMSDLEKREALRAGYLPIPWHPQAPRPPGQPASPMAFARAWLETAGLDPERLSAVRIGPEGEAEVALLDAAAPRRGVPSRWCLREGAAVRIARIQFEPKATVVFADAPDAAARVLVGDERTGLAILGRVVWSGRLDPSSEPAAKA